MKQGRLSWIRFCVKQVNRELGARVQLDYVLGPSIPWTQPAVINIIIGTTKPYRLEDLAFCCYNIAIPKNDEVTSGARNNMLLIRDDEWNWVPAIWKHRELGSTHSGAVFRVFLLPLVPRLLPRNIEYYENENVHNMQTNTHASNKKNVQNLLNCENTFCYWQSNQVEKVYKLHMSEEWYHLLINWARPKLF